MKIKCLIVDDEVNNLEALKILLAYIPDLEVIGAFNHADEAIKAIPELNPDVLFLDIQMPFMSGFDLLHALKDPEKYFVIFVTAHSDFAIKAIKVNAIDYLLKPIVFSELKDAIQKVRDKMEVKPEIKTENNGNRISLPGSKGYELIQTDEIIRCQGTGSYTDFYLTENRKYTVSKNIGEFEIQLQNKGLFRVHASHIINPVFARRYLKEDGGYVVMQDGAQVPVSRRKKDEVLKLLLG